MFKVYDLKNRKKIVLKGTAKQCSEFIGCDITYIYKAVNKDLTIFNRFKVAKAK